MTTQEQIAYQTETRNIALCEIDQAFERGELSTLEARKAEAELDEQYPLAVK